MTGYVPTSPGNPSYWRKRLEHDELAPVAREGSNAKVQDLSLALQYPVFAIGVRSNMARSYWWLGCYVDMQIYTGVRTGSSFAPLTTVGQEKVALNKLNYFQFPILYQSPYWLALSFPKWLKHIYVEVWEYYGEITSDSPEISLLEVQSAINRIERKIDNL